MKKDRMNSTRNERDKRVYRKMSLDLDDRDPSRDAFRGAPADQAEGFDFDEEDIRRYREMNLRGEQIEERRSAYRYRKENIEPEEYREEDEEKSSSSASYVNTVISGLANKKKTNKEIRRVAYTMLILMFCLVAYLIWFNLIGARDVVNNPNNVLLSRLGEKVERGMIVSADGEVLAQTLQAEDGSYYRNYPYGSVYAHVIGTNEVNRSGVEKTSDYDLIMSDINPAQKILNDIEGVRNPGNTVVTTLDSALQQIAYDQLGAREGAVIAMDPYTGKTLAMVSKPDYDPNTLAEYYQSLIEDTSSKVLLNQATQGLFVPGSIFKIVTSTAFFRSGLSPDSYDYYCSGAASLATDSGEEHAISCYGGEVHGEVGLTSSFAESCNSSFANIGQMIPADMMNTVAKDLLFNSELPSAFETSKSVFDLKATDSKWTIGATAIGQGNTQITPLHAAMLVCAIANDGKLMEPYVVDRVENAEGKTVRTTQAEEYGELFSFSEAVRLKKMMEEVVESGTGYNLLGRGYTSAGKTGTAEVAGRGNNAWFIGYAPADDPQIAVCVLVEDAGTGSGDAVPIAAALFDEYLR